MNILISSTRRTIFCSVTLLVWQCCSAFQASYNHPSYGQQLDTSLTSGQTHIPSRSSSLYAVSTPEAPAFSTALSASNSTYQSRDDANETDDVTFPPPLTTTERLARAATFWSSALPIVASYYSLQNRLSLQSLLGRPLDDASVESLWKEAHAAGADQLSATIADLKGFYVKTAQIISSRQDLFPSEYTQALAGFTDNLDPMPASLAKAVVQSELLHPTESFESVFTEFDPEPLGAASVAQVHRARLSERYGGREVAVKIQRPSIESKLMGDVANLKALAKTFRNNPNLPLDYYTVFAELESQLADEFDFVAEAVAMDRIYNALARSPDGRPRSIPLVVPRPVQGLVSRRVLVMDYLKGVPLSRAREEMERKGIDPESPQAKLFGRNLLKALTTVFGRTILETGFFHAEYVLCCISISLLLTRIDSFLRVVLILEIYLCSRMEGLV